MKIARSMLPVLLVVLAPMAMLYPLWSNPLSAGEDDVVYYYPLHKVLGRAMRDGRLCADGSASAQLSALAADPQSAVMHPTSWLFAFLDAKLAYSLSIFAAFSLAGGGAYLYLRRVRLVRPAATFGAAAFMFCGFMVGHRVHLSMILTAAMLPWGLWCIEALASRRRGAFVRMVPVALVALAAGHWPTFVQMCLVWLVYLLVRGRPLARSLPVAAAAMLLAAAVAAPQIAASADLFAQATRGRIGYAEAGENSFFPTAGVLAFFPMLMGSRTPNFFPQRWWGPWHLCEMLGYVGLVTLVLAAAAVWKLYRKTAIPKPTDCNPRAWRGDEEAPFDNRIVRCWTWLAIAAAIWMLGYYLPTYRLIHMLPVLGVIRCPARMVLVVDMALAALAAIAVHAIIVAGPGHSNPLARAIRRAATFALPAVMLATLAVLAIAGAAMIGVWPENIPLHVGGAWDVLAAVRPTNPAVWVPVALCAATVAFVRFWLPRPRRRAVAIVALLLADLFVIARFVDVPPGGAVAADPDNSPAAAWLGDNGPQEHTYRIWGLGRSYFDRPAELLLPKTCRSLGFESIADYGPFLSPAKAHLLGFRIYGTNRDWARLIRRNYLLSMYNVRYILAAECEYRRVIESVRIPAAAPARQGPNLLSDRWRLRRAGLEAGVLRLRTPFLWSWSTATQPVRLQPGRVHRITLDARGPAGGAANFLRAEVRVRLDDGEYFQDDGLGLTVCPERIGEDWRHFEWTFRAPPRAGGKVIFRVFTMSERTIEVRNVSLRRGDWEAPMDSTGRLKPGDRVYRDLTPAGLKPLRKGEQRVHIYENLLWAPAIIGPLAGPADIERLKWSPGVPPATVPDVELSVHARPKKLIWCFTLPAAALYLVVVLASALAGRRGRKSTRQPQTLQRPDT